jgi:hypothetical protein
MAAIDPAVFLDMDERIDMRADMQGAEDSLGGILEGRDRTKSGLCGIRVFNSKPRSKTRPRFAILSAALTAALSIRESAPNGGFSATLVAISAIMPLPYAASTRWISDMMRLLISS